MSSRFMIPMLVLGGLACGEPADPPGPKGEGGRAAPPADTTAADSAERVILFFGNSLTAGFGLLPEQAFPALIQAKLDSARYRFRALNAGLSGETSAGGLRRIDWYLDQPVAVLILELGANDALRGQNLEGTRENLQKIIDRVRARYPAARVVIAGMRMPPNFGRPYAENFRRLFEDLARENRAVLVPFLLEGVGGVATLNQQDGIHPTGEGQRILAENVWRVLRPLLDELAASPAGGGR